MQDHFRCKVQEHKFKELESKSEACPIMSIFHDFESIPIEVNIAIKVFVVERLHGNLAPPAVLDFIVLLFEGEIMLDGAPGEFGLFVLARSEGRCESPECHEDWNGGEKGKEDGRLQPTADFPCAIGRDEKEEREEENVGKSFVSGSIGWQRSILDCRILIARSVSNYSIDKNA
jgi:hypothetical protein